MDLRDKVALITGGARMGGVLAERLAARGVHLACGYHRSHASAETAVAAAQRHGVTAHAIQADLTDPAAARRLVDDVLGSFRRLDFLINMASIYERRPFDRLDVAAWDANLNANLRSAYLLALGAADALRRGGAGRIVNIADWLPDSGRPRYRGYLPYYVSKSGLIGLTEALALELAPDVLVNAVAPGPIIPPPDLTPAENAEVLQATPLGRWGGVEDIARAVLFLIETEFITGECIRVDGGRHLY